MNNTWELIAHCLRDELQEYGGLLGLFEEQQNALFRRDPNGVLVIIANIEEQAKAASVKRSRREQIVSEFASAQNRPADSTLRSLLVCFPADVRPMMEALIDEVNRLIHRTRRCARQNVMLLQKAVEMHQEALRTLKPDAFTKTYSARGQVSVGAPQVGTHSALAAVG
jgi:flagellar biosynthesis/type III secretory pathway chaperone